MRKNTIAGALAVSLFILMSCGAPQPEWKKWLDDYESIGSRYCLLLEAAKPDDETVKNAIIELQNEMKELDKKLNEKKQSLTPAEQEEIDSRVFEVKSSIITTQGKQIQKMFEGMLSGPLGNMTNNPVINAVKEKSGNK